MTATSVEPTTEHVETYSAKRINLADLEARFRAPIRSLVAAMALDVFGSGGCYQAAPGIESDSSEISTTAGAVCWTPDGKRIEILEDPASAGSYGPGFDAIPWADVGSSDYRVFLRAADVPALAERDRANTPRWSYRKERPGRYVDVDSVSEVSGTLEITVTNGLEAAERWTGSGTRPVVVFFETDGRPATHTSEACHVGTLEEDSGDYVVTVPHVFGQASPSTTAGDYRVFLIGYGVTTAARWGANTDGIATGGVVVGSLTGSGGGTETATDDDVAILLSVADFFDVFDEEHDPTDGSHTTITATSVDIGSGPLINSSGIDLRGGQIAIDVGKYISADEIVHTGDASFGTLIVTGEATFPGGIADTPDLPDGLTVDGGAVYVNADEIVHPGDAFFGTLTVTGTGDQSPGVVLNTARRFTADLLADLEAYAHASGEVGATTTLVTKIKAGSDYVDPTYYAEPAADGTFVSSIPIRRIFGERNPADVRTVGAIRAIWCRYYRDGALVDNPLHAYVTIHEAAALAEATGVADADVSQGFATTSGFGGPFVDAAGGDGAVEKIEPGSPMPIKSNQIIRLQLRGIQNGGGAIRIGGLWIEYDVLEVPDLALDR